MENIRIGMIGGGFIGREQARSLRLMKPFFGERVKLVGIADLNEKMAAEVAKEFEFEYYTTDPQRVLNDDSINTIFSCVPTIEHEKIVESVTRQGKALFLEKPFAVSHEIASKMSAQITQSKIPCQVGFVLRFTPLYHVLRDELQKRGEESEIMTFILRDDQKFPVGGSEHAHFTSWRGDVKQAGAGVLVEHGIHDIDIVEWFFGPIKSVKAERKNFAGVPGIEDYIRCEITFASGLSAVMVHLWHDIEAHQAIRHFEFFFKKAFITLDGYGNEGFTVRDNSAYHTYNQEDVAKRCKQLNFFPELLHRIDVVPFSDYYAIQDYAFLKGLLNNEPLEPGMNDGFRAYSIVMACYHSANNNGIEVNVNSFIV